MQKSDNFPICSIVESYCPSSDGKIFVYTGFPVKSAIVSLVSASVGAELVVDMSFGQIDGFYVHYNHIVPQSIIKFSYQAI
jgi:hypothetical protein